MTYTVVTEVNIKTRVYEANYSFQFSYLSANSSVQTLLHVHTVPTPSACYKQPVDVSDLLQLGLGLDFGHFETEEPKNTALHIHGKLLKADGPRDGGRDESKQEATWPQPCSELLTTLSTRRKRLRVDAQVDNGTPSVQTKYLLHTTYHVLRSSLIQKTE